MISETEFISIGGQMGDLAAASKMMPIIKELSRRFKSLEPIAGMPNYRIEFLLGTGTKAEPVSGFIGVTFSKNKQQFILRIWIDKDLLDQAYPELAEALGRYLIEGIESLFHRKEATGHHDALKQFTESFRAVLASLPSTKFQRWYGSAGDPM